MSRFHDLFAALARLRPPSAWLGLPARLTLAVLLGLGLVLASRRVARD